MIGKKLIPLLSNAKNGGPKEPVKLWQRSKEALYLEMSNCTL